MDKTHLSIVIGIVLIAIVVQWSVLYLLHRPFTCPCGVFTLWSGDIHTATDSQEPFDWYSLLHVLYGIIAYYLIRGAQKKFGWPMLLGIMILVAVSVGWEVYENTPYFIYNSVTQQGDFTYQGDSIVNSLMDTVCVVIGFWLAYQFPVWPVIGLAIVLEITCTTLVHDGVILSMVAFSQTATASLLNGASSP